MWLINDNRSKTKLVIQREIFFIELINLASQRDSFDLIDLNELYRLFYSWQKPTNIPVTK